MSGAGVGQVLMDICMPVMDGMEVTKRVRDYERTGKWDNEKTTPGDPGMVITPPTRVVGERKHGRGSAKETDLVDDVSDMAGHGNGEEEGRGGTRGVPLPHLPIVAMTANALSDCESQCSANGMDGFITKPITFQKLTDALQVYLDQEVCL